ncbi:hypothetical protein [Streptomyces clavuligerus]|nr:hypothetical protein [Streptomyces clavuligerus]EDY51765.1 hypothetical protein SSCG_04836 [Streptomyces clavuligerus]
MDERAAAVALTPAWCRRRRTSVITYGASVREIFTLNVSVGPR